MSSAAKPGSVKPPEIVAVVGPTATGKTVVGAALARHFQTEVISVDSQLVYRELSIGVARPTEAEVQGVPHHLIGIISPAEECSAGRYAELARPIMESLIASGKHPVLVGGTGFYLRALLQPGHLPQVPVHPEIRGRLTALAQKEGVVALHARLQKLDPDRASQINPNDSVRLVRALEIIEVTGRPISQTPTEPVYPTRFIGLTYADRALHIQRIRKRLFRMIEDGFLEEVRQIETRYGDCPALHRAHGYPELRQVLHGERSLENALEQIAINIRQYSKRQMTWFRRLPGIRWYEVDTTPLDEVITDVVDNFH